MGQEICVSENHIKKNHENFTFSHKNLQIKGEFLIACLKRFNCRPCDTRFYSTTKKSDDLKNFSPLITYLNVDTHKIPILKDNKNKIGIYKWVNIINGDTYIGSSGNLADRFRQYLNINYLEEISKRNNSRIYRSLIKNGYSNFILEIIEYCSLDVLIKREQYFIDTLNPVYNINITAGSMKGFKHSDVTKATMNSKKKASVVSEETKLRIANTLSKGITVTILNRITNKSITCLSIRDAAKVVSRHHSYSSKRINIEGYFVNTEYIVYKSTTSLDSLLKDDG